MTLNGIVQNGTIILDHGAILPEGARVEVIVKPSAVPPPEESPSAETPPAELQSLRDLLMEFAGTCPGLPADFAAQHDHYIHGTPKR